MRRARVMLTAVVAVLAIAGCTPTDEPVLEVGDCVDLTGVEPEAGSLPVIDCSEPHEAEVFHVLQLEWDQPYNTNAMGVRVDELCLPVFEEYVGIGYWDSFLEFHSILPTEEGWNQGQRDVYCFLYELDYEELTLVPLTGSEQGSAR